MAGNFRERLLFVKERLVGDVLGKTQELLHQFNDTVPTTKALGLSVSDLSFKMGIPPEIRARLTGSVMALNQDKIKELIESQKDNKAVAAIVEALRTAANFKDQLNRVGFKGIKVDVRLGLFPSVEVGLLADESPLGASRS